MTDIVDRAPAPESLGAVVIRFAGDSGDGMQLTGDRFTSVSAWLGNDLATLPEFPAEIRAPAGTLAGVSAFQVHISDHDITTPGDAPNVLIAMNPAALRNELHRVEQGGTLIINTDTFDERNLEKAGYAHNPLTDDSLRGFRVVEVPMTSLTKEATAPLGVKPRDADRSKNFFALGLICWVYSRPIDQVLDLDRQPLRRQRARADGEPRRVPGRLELRRDHRGLRPPVRDQAGRPAGRASTPRSPATPRWRGAWWRPGSRPTCPCSSAATRSRPPPTSSTSWRSTRTSACARCRPRTRSPRVGTALGAAFAGHLGVTTTSGPGLALKSETISLAISLELPLLVIDIQRGGPSTGLPTKTEAADLNLALYGRHAEAPLPVVAAYRPSHCFDAAIEAARIALKYRTPVILLSDGYIANGAEPWKLPDVETLPDISVPFATELNHERDDGTLEFWPYLRDPETLARPWAIPGTPGLMHRVGGIEKEDGSGNISYEPENHERMVHLRAAKVAGIAKDIPPAGGAGRRRRGPPRGRLGLDVGGHRRRRSSGWPARARRWPGSTSSTSTRCRPTWARSSAATATWSCPR